MLDYPPSNPSWLQILGGRTIFSPLQGVRLCVPTPASEYTQRLFHCTQKTACIKMNVQVETKDVGFDKGPDYRLTPVYQENTCIRRLFEAHQWGG